MDPSITRRTAFGAALLPLAVAGTASPARAQGRTRGRARAVVVFLSRSGNTRVLAGALARRHDADLFELRPRDPWPDDYEEMVAWATRMRKRPDPLPVAESLPGITGYDTVFLGFPVWGMALPAVMDSFLRSHDLRDKTVGPFVTHGGYGEGQSLISARALAPRARFLDPFVLECDQERAALRQLDTWLEGVQVPI